MNIMQPVDPPSDCDPLEPIVEFGTGWAKVHFRRELTDRVSPPQSADSAKSLTSIVGCLRPSLCWKLPCPLDANGENMCRKPKCAEAGPAQAPAPTDEMLAAIRAWLDCPAEKRPSSTALGIRIAAIADAISEA